MRINIKVVTLGFIFLLLYVGASYLYLKMNLERLYDVKYTEVSQSMKSELDVLIREQAEAILLIDIAISQRVDVRNLLLNNDETNLMLTEYASLIKENSSYKDVWFHIIDKDGVSRYRSWSDKRGDSVLEFRKDLREMIKEQKISSVISTGIYNMTFKSLVPIYHEGKFIGSVETISDFQPIVSKLTKHRYNTIVLIDKKYKSQLTQAPAQNFIEDYYISSFSGEQKIIDCLVENGVEHFLGIKNYLKSKNDQLFSLYKLLDIHKQEMGYFVMGIDIQDINTTSIEEAKKKILTTLIFGFLIITAFLSYLYMVNYKNYIQKQQKNLEESVKQKTQELREKSEEMTHLAHHDSLTDLPNRLLFEKKLQESIGVAKELNYEVGVLFLDLDSFKEVNDTYGHKTGDLLLKAITKRLRKIVREDDIVARLGGDEFTVIVQNTSHEKLEKIANKIIIEIQQPINIENLELFITFSIGLSVYPEDGETTELLLKYADTAMYRAKDEGKNRYQFYNSQMTEMTLERVTLQNALREAIALEQFEPYYQPKIDARNGKVVGLEALVRWNHPQRGLVPPMDFIPFAEESGLIKDIDEFMLSATLKQMKEWHSEGVQTGKISVNISTKQLQDVVCVEYYKKTIEAIGFDTSYLMVEVTESQIMKNQRKSIEILTLLKDLGITVSMDDFGTGYS